MKRLLILLLCIVLAGCTNINNDENLIEKLNYFFNFQDNNYDIRFNHTSKYFTYYLPSDVIEIDSNVNAAILKFNNSNIIMNLNITGIIDDANDAYTGFRKDGFFDDKKLISTYYGELINADNISTKYNYDLYKDNDEYLIHFITSDLNFYVTTIYSDVFNITRRLMLIASSTSVDRDAVINEYFNKNIIDYDKKQINLFEYSMPSSGLLSELVDYTNGTINPKE